MNDPKYLVVLIDVKQTYSIVFAKKTDDRFW